MFSGGMQYQMRHSQSTWKHFILLYITHQMKLLNMLWRNMVVVFIIIYKNRWTILKLSHHYLWLTNVLFYHLTGKLFSFNSGMTSAWHFWWRQNGTMETVDQTFKSIWRMDGCHPLHHCCCYMPSQCSIQLSTWTQYPKCKRHTD